MQNGMANVMLEIYEELSWFVMFGATFNLITLVGLPYF